MFHHRSRKTRVALESLAAFFLALSLLGAYNPVSASGGQQDIAILTTNQDGTPNVDVCYVLADYSNEGCDRNQDGEVTFADVEPGEYVVHQTAELGDGLTVPDFRIQVEEGSTTFAAVTQSDSPADSEDIRIQTIYADGVTQAVDVCYVLVNFSNEGCDRNDDGWVTFDDVPHGTYTLHQTEWETGIGAPQAEDIQITVGEGSTEFIVEVPYYPA